MNIMEGWVEAQGARLFYEIRGEGVPVLLIHGGFVDRRMWNPQFEELARHFRVIRFDGRGHGKSDAPLDSFSYTRDLIAMLDHLQLDQLVAVGFSRGCNTALELCVTQPKRIKGVVVAAPGLSSYPYSAEFMEYIQSLLAMGDSGRSDEAIQAILEDPYWKLEDDRTTGRQLLEEIMTENANLFSWYLEATHTEDKPLLPRLKDIRSPVLLVAPQREYPDNRAVVDLLASQLPAVQVLAVENAGHFVNIDQPDVFNREVVRFIRNL
jgi:pimeloyl-ACP methyl ester carboxylesterase